MTQFEQLCANLNVKAGTEYEKVVCSLANDLIFDEKRSYTDDEIFEIVTEKFKNLFPYLF